MLLLTIALIPSLRNGRKRNPFKLRLPVRFSNRNVHLRAIPICWPAAVLHVCMPRAICASTAAACKTRWVRRRALRSPPCTTVAGLRQIHIHSTNQSYSKTMESRPSTVPISSRTWWPWRRCALLSIGCNAVDTRWQYIYRLRLQLNSIWTRSMRRCWKRISWCTRSVIRPMWHLSRTLSDKVWLSRPINPIWPMTIWINSIQRYADGGSAAPPQSSNNFRTQLWRTEIHQLSTTRQHSHEFPSSDRACPAIAFHCPISGHPSVNDWMQDVWP